MLRVKVDRSESVALHDQVAAELRRAIAAGEASPGERLPPAKDLAAVLGVNINTVFRALRLLRDEGLLEFKRGRGVTVAGTPDAVRSSKGRSSSWISPGSTATGKRICSRSWVSFPERIRA